MTIYHKIDTIYKRDPDNNFRTLLDGEYATPELAYLFSNQWVFTEKVDGTNIRVMLNNSSLTFGGKTDQAQIPATLYTKLAERFHVEEIIETFNGDDDIVLYGEGYGAKIQKGGGNYRQDQDFVLFDVKVGNWWLQRKDVEDVADKLNLDVVPVIGSGNLVDMVAMARKGFNSAWGDFIAEGIVARPRTELYARNGGRIITKIKHKDFI